MTTAHDPDVIIAGAGIPGVTLALSLAQAGLRPVPPLAAPRHSSCGLIPPRSPTAPTESLWVTCWKIATSAPPWPPR